MSYSINEHFLLENPESIPDLEFYLNSSGEIFAQEYDTQGGFYFTINKEDWQGLKAFIDAQFEQDAKLNKSNG